MAWYVTSAIDALGDYGDRIALSHRGRDIRYRELRDDVYRTANGLRQHGLTRGDGLVLIAANRPEAFTIRLAAFVLGLRFTPLVPRLVDPRYVAADSEAAMVIAESPVEMGVPVLTLDEVAGTDATPMPVAAREEDVARVLYTGGTTGLPKGVPSTYAALGASTRAWGAAAGMPEGMRYLLVTPFAHGSGDAALNMLRFGATVEILDGFDVTEFVAAVERAPMAITYLYPSWLYRLLDHPSGNLDALKFLTYGSAPAAPARIRQALDRFGPILMQTYATTEAPAIAMLDAAGHAARPELLASVGKPLPGVDVELRASDGAAVPTGEVGEVCVRGGSVMSGYWRRPDLTATVLRDGWLHTGDLGRFDADGYLFLVGRLKDMIIVDGYNHYAGPIEDMLTDHPAVREAAVVGAPDDRTGEAIHAFVVADGTSAEELRNWAAQRLPVPPATITFVGALPLTPLGKPDKNELRARAATLTVH